MSLCVYRNNSPQSLDPFFDDEADIPDCALMQPIPMQSTESHLPVVLHSLFVKCCASGVGFVVYSIANFSASNSSLSLTVGLRALFAFGEVGVNCKLR